MFITPFLMSCFMVVAHAQAPTIGDYARAFSLPIVNTTKTTKKLGQTKISISTYTGLKSVLDTKALVLYFFNLSEGQELVGELEQLQRSYKRKGVHVVAICTESGSVTSVSKWVERNISSIPVLRDSYQIVQDRYGVKGNQLFIIDELGRIFAQAKPSESGFSRELKKELDALIHQSEMGEIRHSKP